MEQLQHAKLVIVKRMQQLQMTLDAKDYGHWSTGVAAVLMLAVFCPMSIIVVAEKYWSQSADAHGATLSAKVSLWTVSASMEVGGESTESETDMCGDEMQGFDDCGKIHALRFFTITALLFSFASASMLLAAFLPLLKNKEWLRAKAFVVGASLACVVLLWDFLSICIAAGVDMGEGYSLDGVGFVFMILELLFMVLVVIALAVQAVTTTSPSVVSKPIVAWGEKPHSQTPNLLVLCSASQSSLEKKNREQPQTVMDNHSAPPVVVMGASSQKSKEGMASAVEIVELDSGDEEPTV